MRDYSLEDMEEEKKEFYSKETKPTRERENMPEISAAARETHSEYPEYNKQHISREKNRQPVIKTCKTCNKQYDQEETNQIIATLPTIANFDYDKQCLNCIKEDSQAIKTTKQPELKKSKQNLANITIVYQETTKKYKALSKEYQELDYQENMINHHLTKPIKTPKTSTSKKKQTSDQIKQATAMKILKNLTEEQQAAILTIMKKQEK